MYNEFKNWEFLKEEIGKIQVILQLYKNLIDIIEIKNSRYNLAFLLILNSFTKTICTSIAIFFDNKYSFSLYSFKNLDQIEKDKINDIKYESREFINFRHEKVAHNPKNPKYFTQKNNFDYLTLKGILRAEQISKKIEQLLDDIGKKKSYDTVWAFWSDIEGSTQCLIEDLKK